MTVHKLPRTTRFLHFILSFLADILIRYPQNGQSSEHFVSFNVIECLLPPSVLTNEYGVITSKIGLDPIKTRSHTAQKYRMQYPQDFNNNTEYSSFTENQNAISQSIYSFHNRNFKCHEINLKGTYVQE